MKEVAEAMTLNPWKSQILTKMRSFLGSDQNRIRKITKNRNCLPLRDGNWESGVELGIGVHERGGEAGKVESDD